MTEQERGGRRCETCRYWREDPIRSPAIPRSGRCLSATVSREVASSPITTSYSFGCLYWDAIRESDRDERLREAEAAAIVLYDYLSNLQRAFGKALRDLDTISIRHFGKKQERNSD